jgi:threonine synthase
MRSALTGNFDDCQARVKDMFNDFAFRDRVRLAGVNSINWARVLAQVVYYFTAAVSLGAPHRGQLLRAHGQFRRHLRGPYRAAHGPADREADRGDEPERHPAPGAVSTGDYVPDGVTPSISPSMDIQVSSNFERALFDAYGRDGGAVAQLMEELKAGGFHISARARWRRCARASPRAAHRRRRPAP